MVNAHGTTRLESYCCRTHSEHTLLSLSNHIDIPLMPLSLPALCDALSPSLSLSTLFSRKRKEKLKEISHWDSAYFVFVVTICVCTSGASFDRYYSIR